METTEALATTDVNHANNPATRPIAREPRPPYEQDGEVPDEGKTISNGISADSSKRRPVTAATAYRRELWQQGTLIYEDSSGRLEVTEIDEDLTACAEPSTPGLGRQSLDLQPAETLTFVPDAGAPTSGTSGYRGYCQFDEIDTREALRHVRSALEEAESLDRRPILGMTLKRHLRCARQLLEDHAERNGFDT